MAKHHVQGLLQSLLALLDLEEDADVPPDLEGLFPRHQPRSQSTIQPLDVPTIFARSADEGISISKIDEEKRRVFGFASVAKIQGEELVDLHGDVLSPETLEEAAAEFRGTAGVNHQGDPVGEVFESVLIDATKARSMGMEPTDPSFVGWWIGVQLQEGPIWDAVRKGELGMFSIQGRAMVDDEDED